MVEQEKIIEYIKKNPDLLQKIEQETQQPKKQGPKFRVYTSGKDEKLVEIGAIWEHTSKNGKKYLKLSLEKLIIFPVEEEKR